MPLPLRFGPGPVFVYESIAASRRWQLYALRSLFVTSLLAALALIWLFTCAEEGKLVGSISLQDLAQGGQYIYYAISTTQLIVVLLVAPAATAGAISLDRARGNLTHALVTDLTDREVVLGKLAARLLPVFALVAATVPVLAIAGLLGGVIFEAIGSLTLITLAVAIFGCSLALALSVRSTRTHEVLMVVYGLESVWILGAPACYVLAQNHVMPSVPEVFVLMNPFVLAWAAYAWPGAVSGTWLAALLVGLLLISAGCVLYAVTRLRAELTSGHGSRPLRFALWLEKTRARLFYWRPRPSLDADPVLWREWHRGRSTLTAKVMWGLFYGLSIAGLATGIMTIGENYQQGKQLILMANAFQANLGLLLISLYAPTVLAEERMRGSLDVLLTTPLATARILRAKWRGVFGRVPALALLPAIGCLAIAYSAPEQPVSFRRFGPAPGALDLIDRIAYVCLPMAFLLAQGAVVTSIGLALATWISRIGRAVAISVTIFVLFAVGWILFIEVGQALLDTLGLWPNAYLLTPEYATAALGAVCPLGGQYFTFETATWPPAQSRVAFYITQLIVLLATIEVAALVYALTVLTFDQCVGRVSERPRRVPRPRPSGGTSFLSPPHLLKSIRETADRQ
jgi:ABC-type transport system involved in multi-copper enzyme maturation permease subunit